MRKNKLVFVKNSALTVVGDTRYLILLTNRLAGIVANQIAAFAIVYEYVFTYIFAHILKARLFSSTLMLSRKLKLLVDQESLEKLTEL